jgi:hypothetical protein
MAYLLDSSSKSKVKKKQRRIPFVPIVVVLLLLAVGAGISAFLVNNTGRLTASTQVIATAFNVMASLQAGGTPVSPALAAVRTEPPSSIVMSPTMTPLPPVNTSVVSASGGLSAQDRQLVDDANRNTGQLTAFQLSFNLTLSVTPDGAVPERASYTGTVNIGNLNDMDRVRMQGALDGQFPAAQGNQLIPIRLEARLLDGRIFMRGLGNNGTRQVETCWYEFSLKDALNDISGDALGMGLPGGGVTTDAPSLEAVMSQMPPGTDPSMVATALAQPGANILLPAGLIPDMSNLDVESLLSLFDLGAYGDFVNQTTTTEGDVQFRWNVRLLDYLVSTDFAGVITAILQISGLPPLPPDQIQMTAQQLTQQSLEQLRVEYTQTIDPASRLNVGYSIDVDLRLRGQSALIELDLDALLSNPNAPVAVEVPPNSVLIRSFDEIQQIPPCG